MATILIMASKDESQGLFEKNEILPHYCGMGQVKAAFYTQKLIHELKPKHVINLGTAGSYSFKQGELVECTSFVQRRANNFLPFKSKILTTSALTDLTSASCGTGDFIDKDRCLVKCDVMDMEAYAMAYVCEQMKVGFTSIKYVSDNSNEGISTDWNTNLKDASEKLFTAYKLLQNKLSK